MPLEAPMIQTRRPFQDVSGGFSGAHQRRAGTPVVRGVADGARLNWVFMAASRTTA
jgi:hypothetical protein